VLIYSIGFWGPYLCSGKDMELHEAILKFIIYLTLNLIVAFLFQFSLAAAQRRYSNIT
jgi:hypothetical protein